MVYLREAPGFAQWRIVMSRRFRNMTGFEHRASGGGATVCTLRFQGTGREAGIFRSVLAGSLLTQDLTQDTCSRQSVPCHKRSKMTIFVASPICTHCVSSSSEDLEKDFLGVALRGLLQASL